VTIALIDGSQRMRSLSSRPAYALMPKGHAPGAWFSRAQPGEVLTVHAAHAVGVDSELLDPIAPGVCRRRVHRKAEPTSVALVVRGSQHDGGCARVQLAGNGERVEQQEVVAELDPVRRNDLGPPLLLDPVRVRRLRVPDTGAQLRTGRNASCAGIEKTHETA
jgi:hypothetical protein